MPKYNYSIAEINICLKTPFQIDILESSKPFVEKKGINTEEAIVFYPRKNLPSIVENGIWIEDSYYAKQNNQSIVAYRNEVNECPYAVLLEKTHGAELYYLENIERFFLDTRGILNHIGIEKILLNYSAFLLHASFIKQEGKAILFSAPCGTGKSTQAELWAKHKGTDILNGDRAAVRYHDGEWRAYGMPFAGTSGIYRNESAPVSAIIVLEQGKKNEIRKLSGREALSKLLPECSCRRWDADFMGQLMDLLIRLLAEIPVYLLSCLPDEGAVDLLYNTLKKDQRL